MRTNWGCSVTISTQWWLSFEFSFFPDELVIGIENNKVINICRRNEILLSSCPWVDAPSSEEDNIRAANIGSMAITREWRCTRNPHPCPFIFLSVQNSNVVEITRLELSPLSKSSISLRLLVKIETTLDDHVCSYLDGCVALSWGW